MRVTFINVGYGDAILIQTDDGGAILLDGGSALPQEFRDAPMRIRAADFLRAQHIDHLDAVVISHIHEDHVCGLRPILDAIPTDILYVPYPVAPFLQAPVLQPAPDAPRSVPLYTKALNDFRHILCTLSARGVPIRTLVPGDEITPVPGLTFTVLAPSPAAICDYMDSLQQAYAADDPQTVTRLLTLLDATSNHTSLLLRLDAGQTGLLFAADLCPSGWSDVPFSLLENVNVLKLPHHGQIDSISEPVMAHMPLTHVITTASSDRRYNSANPAVYQRLSVLYPHRPRFLFTDERSYPPYFEQSEGFQALSLVIHSGQITPEFIKINPESEEVEERT